MERDKILIIGGYGAVGRVISTYLAEKFPHKVIIAGRDGNKAADLAAMLHHNATAMSIDISHPEAAELPPDVRIVVMCLDLPDISFARHCILRGIHYIDITASHDILKQLETLDTEARQHDTGVLLSIGLAPGITNLLAAHTATVGHLPRKTDIFVLLGLGEAHGDKAFQWTFNNIHTTYTIGTSVSGSTVKSFTDGRTTHLAGKRKFYLFNFSDQHTLSSAFHNIPVRTRLAFDSRMLTTAMAWLRRTGLTALYRLPLVQRWMTRIFRSVKMGSDIFGVKAITTFADGTTIAASLEGHGEGEATGLTAALLVQKMYEGAPPPGVSHIQEYITDIPAFLNALQAYDTSLQLQMTS